MWEAGNYSYNGEWVYQKKHLHGHFRFQFDLNLIVADLAN